MKVLWTPEAYEDRLAIWDFLVSESPQAANRLDALFNDAADRLGEHPSLGPPGKVEGTRELIPHPSYRLIYEITGEIVWILAIVHTARQWPPVEIEPR